jgi:hypothetical protein
MEVSPAKPLWQHGLDWLVDTVDRSTHPLDRERARKLARGMRMVGEHPPYREVSAYVGKLWDGWPHTASMVRECWRSVYRAKTSLGRDRHWHTTPLFQPDRLIEQHELRPVTEVRLAAVLHGAVDALLLAAQGDDTDAYLTRTRDLDAALIAVRHLRFLRHGSAALGFQDLNPEPARRPRWW